MDALHLEWEKLHGWNHIPSGKGVRTSTVGSFCIYVLVAAHLELLSGLSVWGKGETGGNRCGGGVMSAVKLVEVLEVTGCRCLARAVVESGSQPSVGGREPSSPPADPAMSITKKWDWQLLWSLTLTVTNKKPSPSVPPSLPTQT